MLKELKDTSPANEAEGQNTSASCMKFLENGHDSETSTVRESSTDVDVNDVQLKTSSFWLHVRHGFKKCLGMKKSKLKQHNTNAADKIFLVKEIITAV